MTIVRVGSNEKYADGWLQAFGKGVKANKKSADSTAKKKSPKPVKKKSAKKGGKK